MLSGMSGPFAGGAGAVYRFCPYADGCLGIVGGGLLVAGWVSVGTCAGQTPGAGFAVSRSQGGELPICLSFGESLRGPGRAVMVAPIRPCPSRTLLRPLAVVASKYWVSAI